MTGDEFLRSAIRALKGHSYRTMSELAQRAGISQGNLSGFMKDNGKKKDMNLNTAWKIFEALGLIAPKLPIEQDKEEVDQGLVEESVKELQRLSKENLELRARLAQSEHMNDKLLQMLSGKAAGSFLDNEKKDETAFGRASN